MILVTATTQQGKVVRLQVDVVVGKEGMTDVRTIEAMQELYEGCLEKEAELREIPQVVLGRQ